ncbi:MAG TPA: glycosyltransferase family 2 protein [Elusimicrobia bacterium]|nr:glycosyltransferase family 2 protein [Elusimicrobiota bacterium]
MGLFSNKPEITVVIPAYNEEGAITPTIKGAAAALAAAGLKFEIITVDDGSCDGTAAAAEAAGSRVIRHPLNRGYGRSLVSGIEAAKNDWVLIIDADGSYPPAEIAKLLPCVPDFDMVVGARQGKLFWGSYTKAFMRWTYLALARFVAGEPIPDANSGLRIFRKSAAKNMPIICFGYSFTTTMTLSFMSSGLFVKFVPIEFAERVGKSKVKPVRDILRTLQIMTQVVIHYNPLKFAAALASVPAALAALNTALLFFPCDHSRHLALACILASLAVAVFMAGCVLQSMKTLLDKNACRNDK